MNSEITEKILKDMIQNLCEAYLIEPLSDEQLNTLYCHCEKMYLYHNEE